MIAPYPVDIDRTVRVTMTDGVDVALTLYLPDAPGDGPFPAVVESVPYRKDDDCFARDWVTFQYMASRGFAGVRIDIRGTGASGGVIEDEYVEREQLDTLEVLSWVAAQEWCSGAIGMWGISWGGFSALQTAMLRPPELRAIAAAHATHDRFACDVHYQGGALHLFEQVDWPTAMVALNALPPDPELVGDRWREMWLERLGATPQWLPQWLSHQWRDEYWLHGSPLADYGSITAPTLLFGGWLDGYVDGIVHLLENLTCPRRAVIGPWGHYRPATGEPGPAFDHLTELERWFGRWLRGDDNGADADPTLTAFVRGSPPFDEPGSVVSGHWVDLPQWPVPGETGQVLHLGSELAAKSPDRWEGPFSVGSASPLWDPAGWGSADTSGDDASSLCFESEPMIEPVVIMGRPVADLDVMTDRPYGHVAVRLVDVAPDGSSRLITRGLLNLVFGNGWSDPAPVTPGEWRHVSVEMRATSATVAKGHRLRLAVSGADFAIAWPPPGAFTLAIRGADSMLRLPTMELPTPASSPAAVPRRSAPVVSQTDTSSIEVRHDDGATTLVRAVESIELQPERGDLVYSSAQRVEVAVPDVEPSACRAWSEATVGLTRGEWIVAATGTVTITSTVDAFHLDIDLVATEGGSIVFKRSWRYEIGRHWV